MQTSRPGVPRPDAGKVDPGPEGLTRIAVPASGAIPVPDLAPVSDTVSDTAELPATAGLPGTDLPAPSGLLTPPTPPADALLSFQASFTPVVSDGGYLAGLRLRRLRTPIRPVPGDGPGTPVLSGDAVLAAFQQDLLGACRQALATDEPTWLPSVQIPGFPDDVWIACLLPVGPQRLDVVAWAGSDGRSGSGDEIFQLAPFGLALCEADGSVRTANGRLQDLLDRNEEILVGRPLQLWAHPADAANAAPGHPEGGGRSRFLRGDGETVWLEVSYTPLPGNRLLASLVDVSDHGEEVDRLAQTATQDPLTGLPNRVRILDLITAALADRALTRVSVAYLDLDGFKPVNDTLGHAAGDALLREVARRLSGVIRTGDAVARIGGDEFVVLVRGLDSAVEVEVLARRIQAALAVPFPLDGRSVVTGASVGVAHAGLRATADTLLHEADTAMYAAKRSGRGRYVVYDEGLKAQAVARRASESEIRDALTGRQFEVWYQPIYELPSRTVSGIEALIRWRHPHRGLLTPADFLATVEASGFGIAVGRLVLDRALRDAQALRKSRRSLRHLSVTVNLAGEHLRSPSLGTDVRRALEATKLPPTALVLDLPESQLATADASAVRTLTGLRDLGVGIAADDFGIGTSSLAGLRRLPVTALKIDRALVQGCGEDTDGAAAVVEALGMLGRNLGRAVVAEGVETAGELAAVTRAGCSHAQGYLLSRPMAAADLPTQLR